MRWRVLGDLALGIVDLVAIGQISHLFRVMNAVLFRDHELVSDDVIDVRSPHRSGITKAIDLNRRRALRENPWASTVRVSLEVDGDIDLELAQQFGHSRI